jgi:hypothetical protein
MWKSPSFSLLLLWKSKTAHSAGSTDCVQARRYIGRSMSRMTDLARREQLEIDLCELDFYPSTLRRGRAETLYYGLLSALPPLQRLLPCTITYHFHKARIAPPPSNAGRRSAG